MPLEKLFNGIITLFLYVFFPFFYTTLKYWDLYVQPCPNMQVAFFSLYTHKHTQTPLKNECIIILLSGLRNTHFTFSGWWHEDQIYAYEVICYYNRMILHKRRMFFLSIPLPFITHMSALVKISYVTNKINKSNFWNFRIMTSLKRHKIRKKTS